MSSFQFKRTGDDDYPRFLNVLIQGPPKSGKTTFLSTAPNVVVAACEAGLASIAHLDVPYIDVDGTDKLQSLLIVLGDDALRAQAARSLGMEKIETVAIDTLDAWQEMLKKEILAETRQTSLQQKDWGTLKERMSTTLKAFVSLPVNVIFTVHVSTTQDEESRMIYGPALQGGIKDEIAGYVDFSLLSFRDREVDRQGNPRISYYLKCEGDKKNPHLGGRAAGRLPEIIAPDFMTLHKAVFSGIKRAPRAEAVGGTGTEGSGDNSVPEVDLPVQRVAQTSSHTGVTTVTLPPKPGVPEDNLDGPVNASGMSMLTKAYTEQGLVVPEDLKSWTLGKARTVAKWFMAWKADKASGNEATRDDLINGLTAYDAFGGEMPGIQTGVENLKPKSAGKKPVDNPPAAKLAAAAPEPVKEPEPEVKDDDAVKTETADPEEAAVTLLEEQLGAQVISHGASEGAKCDTCGEPVDDPDIANLAVMKFKKALCVRDYKERIKQVRSS